MTTGMILTPERTSLLKSQGTDPAGIVGLLATMQAIGNRTEWNAKSLIVPSAKSLDTVGNDYPYGLSYLTVNPTGTDPASFGITASVGDLVVLSGAGDLNFDTAASTYSMRWYDGAVAISEQTWTTTVGTSPLSLLGFQVVTVAGAKTYSLQGKRTGSLSVAGDSPLSLFCIHVKLGAT